MNRAGNSDKSGFTIVELMLAMAFISVLLLVIAVTIIQISNSYSKGLTLREVDQAGRSLVSDMRRTIGFSEPFSTESDFLQLPPNNTGNIRDYTGGRLCTGTYTYAWNYGHAIAQGSTVNPINVYDTGDDVIRFIRVRDTGGGYCANPDLPINRDGATEMLSAADYSLALQSFSIDMLANDSVVGQALYRITMEIGTNDQNALVLNTIDTECKPPNDVQSADNFCAVNKFDFTAQAGYRGGL